MLPSVWQICLTRQQKTKRMLLGFLAVALEKLRQADEAMEKEGDQEAAGRKWPIDRWAWDIPWHTTQQMFFWSSKAAFGKKT